MTAPTDANMLEQHSTRHTRQEDTSPHGRFAVLRQVLNIAFMVGAVAGVIIYMRGSHSTGTVIILAAMVLKFIECVLRLLK